MLFQLRQKVASRIPKYLVANKFLYSPIKMNLLAHLSPQIFEHFALEI